MSYDRNGNWDYEAAAMEQQLSRRPSGLGTALARGGKAIGLLVLLALGLGVFFAASWGGYYLTGRAVGAGVRDAVRGSR